MQIKFPNNKQFAFSIFDDTDGATVENVKPIYDLLAKLKIYTTKSIWVLPTNKPKTCVNYGQTLSNPVYRDFILELRNKGFEIGFHGPRDGHSKRSEIIAATEEFKKIISYYPRTYVNHLDNKENIYWGADRLTSPLLKILYKIATIRRKQIFTGNLPFSENFWGDICKDKIKYVRNFVFPGINTLSYNPSMPYHDPKKSYVNFWFSSSDGHDVNTFNKLLVRKNIDKLEKENGVCIVYTHFANGFIKNNEVNQETKRLLVYLSEKNGWFVPISTLLDFLKNQRKEKNISKRELKKMDYKWFFFKTIHGAN